jgi:uncharacterized membrane protein YfcA
MWFEVAVVATLFAVGNIVFGHFEEGTPKWRRIAKLALFAVLGVFVSSRFGRTWFWVLLAVPAVAVVVIHAWWLPRHGINGWTGEPREKYYALRGWKWPGTRR